MNVYASHINSLHKNIFYSMANVYKVMINQDNSCSNAINDSEKLEHLEPQIVWKN